MAKVQSEELGVCNALIDGIATKIDGSCTIKLSVLPEDQKIINKLMSCYLNDQKLITVAFVRSNE